MRCLLLLHSSLTLLPGQWDCRQSCKYTLGATFIIISQKILIARHKSFGCATIARHNIKHVLWRAIAACMAFYSRPGLYTNNNVFFRILKNKKILNNLLRSLNFRFPVKCFYRSGSQFIFSEKWIQHFLVVRKCSFFCLKIFLMDL